MTDQANDEADDRAGGQVDDARVSRLLAQAPSPPMPADVAARLDAVLVSENARRQARVAQDAHAVRAVPWGVVDRHAKPVLVASPAERPRWRRAAGVALVAAVSAAAIGVAGYAVSASVGLDEPSAGAPLSVQSSELAEQARAIMEARNLSAHTFSGAWRCARTVTDGRITALTPAIVDGTPALLVYTSVRGQNWVTVVTGCPEPGALARESVRLAD